MMTGDSERTAAAIAKRVGVDDYFSEVLPEDKARFVEEEKAKGHKVIMIGDGINDSPALSAADAGIAVSEGAEIAREIADITIKKDSLDEVVLLRHLSMDLMKTCPWKLPFRHQLQPGSDSLGGGWYHHTVYVGAAAQQLDTGDQLKEHDEPAAGGRAGRGVRSLDTGLIISSIIK